MGVAALISWLVTALSGLYLLAVWLIETTSLTGAPPPAGCRAGHLGPCPARPDGLVFSVIHLLSGSDAAGWVAVGILGGVATLGLTMFTRWIPVHVAYVAAEAKAAGRPGSASRPDGPSRCRSSPVTACSPARPSPWCCSPC